MNSLKKITVWLLAATAVYAGAAALRPPKARAGINAGVVVNNPASQPVPISGNVGINGMPTVQLAPGANVGINGVPPLVPFQIELCDGSGGVVGPCGTPPPSSFTVPANQRLVIEYVSVRCGAFGSGWSVKETVVGTVAGGNSVVYPFPPGPTDGFGDSISTQLTRIYADPGTPVSLIVLGSTGSGSGSFVCTATLSGNLVTP